MGHDYDNQLAFIEGMRAVIGDDPDFNPRFVDKRGKDGKFSKISNTKVAVPKNVTTIQYLIWGYGVSYATFKRWKAEDFKWLKHKPAHTGKSVLTDAVFAKSIYTPHKMYLDAEMAVWYERQRTQSRRVDAQAKKDHRDSLKNKWTNLKKEDRVPYEKLSRDHAARQPLMKECLVEALQKKKGEIAYARTGVSKRPQTDGAAIPRLKPG